MKMFDTGSFEEALYLLKHSNSYIYLFLITIAVFTSIVLPFLTDNFHLH